MLFGSILTICLMLQQGLEAIEKVALAEMVGRKDFLNMSDQNGNQDPGLTVHKYVHVNISFTFSIGKCEIANLIQMNFWTD